MSDEIVSLKRDKRFLQNNVVAKVTLQCLFVLFTLFFQSFTIKKCLYGCLGNSLNNQIYSLNNQTLFVKNLFFLLDYYWIGENRKEIYITKIN